jgi:hypothetical protein
MTRRKVELHIGELVVEGLGALDSAEVGAAVRQELERLFEERGVPQSLTRSGRLAQVDGGQLSCPARPDASALGAQVARSVYRGVKR